jgi:hypothetical protein
MEYVLYDSEPRSTNILSYGPISRMASDPELTKAFTKGDIELYSVEKSRLFFVVHQKEQPLEDHCEIYLKKNRSQLSEEEYQAALEDCRSNATLQKEAEYWKHRYQVALEMVHGKDDYSQKIENWMDSEMLFFNDHSFSYEDRFYLRQIFAPMILNSNNSVGYALVYSPIEKQQWVKDLFNKSDFGMNRNLNAILDRIKDYYGRYPPTPSRQER